MRREDLSAALPRKCRAAIAEYNMISPGDHLAAALSGGADSVALLHALHALQREGDIPFTLVAVHLNHNLRGSESMRDERFVRRLCADWRIPLTVESLPIAEMARESGVSVELCAREARYALFRRLGGRTATAHTLDDSAETVLFHLARGTGLRGLCGIPPLRGNIVRPLIACTRAEVEAYIAARGLAFVTDSSNLTDAYTRNRLRHAVMPVLREINAAFPAGIDDMVHSLRADADYLDALAEQALARTQRAGDRWSAGGLSALPEPLRRRALRMLLERCKVPVERRRIERLEALLRNGGTHQLDAAWLCRCADGELTLIPVPAPAPPPMRPVELAAPFGSMRVAVLPDKSLRLTLCERNKFEESINILPNGFKNALDCAKIGKIVTIRTRLPGDRIRLAGRGCTKTLKKLFYEAGLSDRQRARTLVLAGEGGALLWVEGFGVAESAQAGPCTERLLLAAAEDDLFDNFFSEGGND